MAYERKTVDEVQIQTDYGDGYEFECAAEDRRDARRLLHEYTENAPQYPHRIKTVRIRKSER